MTNSVATAETHVDALTAGIGHTPLVRLRRFEPHVGVEVHAKLESRNPGGSVKDRAALAIILEGERSGRLGDGRILLDATSGNTGIAYAMIGASRGHRVRLCVPGNVNGERLQLLRAYGAELILTDPSESTDGAQRLVRVMVDESPGKYFYPDQYNNDANWKAHFDTTAPEIWRQTDQQVTHFVAGMGTSGTFMGVSRRLKQFNPAIQCISMQPDGPLHGLEGMKHMATALVPGIYDRTLADEEVEVGTDDAHETTRRLARTHGLMVGVSAGANVFAAMRLARTLAPGSVVVTILCDAGGRYLGDPFWGEGGR
jgi:cysteine synthase B